jgi:hypothetical protein
MTGHRKESQIRSPNLTDGAGKSDVSDSVELLRWRELTQVIEQGGARDAGAGFERGLLLGLALFNSRMAP